MATLAEQMHSQEFDHVWTIVDGNVVDVPGEYAPEVSMFEDENGVWHDEHMQEDWDFVTYGMTGQYGYNGPWMHSSEFISARMANAIAEQAEGYSCFAIVYPSMIALDGEDTEPDGWAIVGKIIN